MVHFLSFGIVALAHGSLVAIDCESVAQKEVSLFQEVADNLVNSPMDYGFDDSSDLEIDDGLIVRDLHDFDISFRESKERIESACIRDEEQSIKNNRIEQLQDIYARSGEQFREAIYGRRPAVYQELNESIDDLDLFLSDDGEEDEDSWYNSISAPSLPWGNEIPAGVDKVSVGGTNLRSVQIH